MPYLAVLHGQSKSDHNYLRLRSFADDLPALSGPPAMRESGGYDRPDAAVGA